MREEESRALFKLSGDFVGRSDGWGRAGLRAKLGRSSGVAVVAVKKTLLRTTPKTPKERRPKKERNGSKKKDDQVSQSVASFTLRNQQG